MDLGRAMDEPSVRIESPGKDERLDLLERLWESLSQTPSKTSRTGSKRASATTSRTPTCRWRASWA